MDCLKRSRVGQFNAWIKHGQLENYLFYCVLHSILRRPELSNTSESSIGQNVGVVT